METTTTRFLVKREYAGTTRVIRILRRKADAERLAAHERHYHPSANVWVEEEITVDPPFDRQGDPLADFIE